MNKHEPQGPFLDVKEFTMIQAVDKLLDGQLTTKTNERWNFFLEGNDTVEKLIISATERLKSPTPPSVLI